MRPINEGSIGKVMDPVWATNTIHVPLELLCTNFLAQWIVLFTHFPSLRCSCTSSYNASKLFPPPSTPLHIPDSSTFTIFTHYSLEYHIALALSRMSHRRARLGLSTCEHCTSHHEWRQPSHARAGVNDGSRFTYSSCFPLHKIWNYCVGPKPWILYFRPCRWRQ